jgi:hypothetical protein
MEMGIRTEEIKEIIFGDNNQFSYSRKQVHITNILGAAVAVLDEYSITDSAGVNYKLYKTKDGNWYDLPEANTGIAKSILLALKLKIDNQ